MLKITILILIFASSITIKSEESISEMEKWKLSWRMFVSNYEENYQLGELQFDSLLSVSNNDIKSKFIIAGLEILDKLEKKEKLLEILENQDHKVLKDICNSDLFINKLKDNEICKSIEQEKISNPKLQMELIKMYVNDQATRGNTMEDIITKYNLERAEITNEEAAMIDEINRERLKEIFMDIGFPTKETVGKDAMEGIFLMIQHSDGDSEWQKSQLPNIKQAVKNGDLDEDGYAYLYDRIKINAGEKQLYGTQFEFVGLDKKTIKLSETEDIENLDNRRMQLGLMPMEYYERLMLKYVSN